jgi:hypothetical protein
MVSFVPRILMGNAFNPGTAIVFQIKVHGLVMLKVYDMLGREVTTLVNEVMSPGTYTARFDGNELASGTYLYRLNTGECVQTRQLMLPVEIEPIFH